MYDEIDGGSIDLAARRAKQKEDTMMRRLSLGAAIAATLVMAACGSGDGNDDASSNTGSASGASGGSADTVAVAEVDGIGEVLVDSAGVALYRADEEADGRVRCIDGCTAFWEPLTVDGTPTGAPGVGELGVTERPDGARQVTADGRLLYTFVQDSPGNVTGDGFADDFGDQHLTWHVVHAGHDTATSPDTNAQRGYPGYGG
jgi:predicted lipoprotein with Yx(FWY)xxD motif